MRRSVERLGPGCRSGAVSLRVVQWNVLADGLSQHGDFVRAPKEVLEWPFRAPLVIEELMRADADVICLEELNHFREIADRLQGEGFAGVFHEKSSSPCEAMGFPKDGTALFWRSSRFDTAGEPSKGIYVDGSGNGLSQGWITQRLVDRGTGAELLVAATHLKAKSDPRSAEMRLLQVAQLRADLAEKAQPRPGAGGAAPGLPPPALVVAGDFNDTPDSPCIQAMLAAGSAPRLLSTHRDDPGAFTTWKFRSGAGGRSESEAKRVIDYIFYAPGEGAGALRPVARWAEPSVEDIGPGALPCSGYPSDHLAQLVEFEWGGPPAADGGAEKDDGGAAAAD